MFSICDSSIVPDIGNLSPSVLTCDLKSTVVPFMFSVTLNFIPRDGILYICLYLLCDFMC